MEPPRRRWLGVVFAGLILLSIGSSLVQQALDLTGLPVGHGPLVAYVTVYPPLILCTLALFWLGFPFAFIAAYLATFVGAMVDGMPLGWAIVFGFADPLGLAVMALAYRVAPLSVRMRSAAAVAAFVAISAVSVLAGATGSFIWCHTNGLGFLESFKVWQGWWIGAFLQNLVVVLPVLVVADRLVRAWIRRRLPACSRPPLSTGWIVAAVTAVFVSISSLAVAAGWLAFGRLRELRSGADLAGVADILEPTVWWLSLAVGHVTVLLALVSVGFVILVVAWGQTIQREVETQTHALRESQERYALAARGANDGLWDWDLTSGELYLSERWKAMLGYSADDVGDSVESWLELIHPDDRRQVEAALEAHAAGHTSHFESEHRIRHRDGSWRWMLSRGLSVRNESGASLRMAGSQTDVTERRAAEDQLLHDAFHDILTGLPNRALFLDRIAGAIARSARHDDYLFAVLFLDIDRFKIVNDSLGHGVGDELLVAISERLGSCIRPTDTVARLGGDEFAVLVDDMADRDGATTLAHRINETLARPFYLSGNEIFTSASIGIASSRTGYTSPEEVLRDADTAMYRAKSLGKARHQEFDTAMHARAMRQLLLETDLRRAMEQQALQVYYQPVVRLDDRRVVGVEALVRWPHPRWGMVAPDEFLPLAEETGLVVSLGADLLRAACRDVMEWRRPEGGADPSLSVNLSGRQLVQGELVALVREILDESGLPPWRLRLEVTESAVVDHLETAAATLQEVRDLGVAVDLDDFGTGYSSLSYLHRLPIDRVKIDRSFIARMLEKDDQREIVRAIVAMAEALTMDCVAEGVEEEEQARVLVGLGCHFAQGYLFGAPVPASQVEADVFRAAI